MTDSTQGDRDLVLSVLLRPGMYAVPTNFDTVCAFLSGFDCGKDGRLFHGFGEWLHRRTETCSNLVWIGVVSMVLAPGVKVGEMASLSRSDTEDIFRRLSDLLKEFWIEIDRTSPHDVIAEYERWHKTKRHDWEK